MNATVGGMMLRKTIVGTDVGKDSHLFDGANVDELVHSSLVLLRDSEKTYVFCSGVVGLDYDEASSGTGDGLVEGGIAEQTEQVIKNLARSLGRIGASLNDIVRVRVYVVAPMLKRDFQVIHEVRARYFDRAHYPASTLVVVAGLARPGALIEVDADAVIANDGDIRLEQPR